MTNNVFEIFISPFAFVAYFLLTMVAMSIASGVSQWICGQKRVIPFNSELCCDSLAIYRSVRCVGEIAGTDC